MRHNLGSESVIDVLTYSTTISALYYLHTKVMSTIRSNKLINYKKKYEDVQKIEHFSYIL